MAEDSGIHPPMVSVLMTAYNREKFIGQAIDSVLASDFADFELIITDDRSKDNTVAIARGYAEKDSRVKVFLNKENLGDYPNRNQAAAHATGKYLKYVDADDYIYPWGLSLLVGMMESFPEAGWGLCSLDQHVGRPFPFELTGREAYDYHYNGTGLFHKAPLSAIIRKDVFFEVGGFSAQRMAGDFEMWHRLASRYKVLLMPQGIVWYREHGEQEMNSYYQFAPKYEEISVRYLTSPECPLEKEAAEAIVRHMRRTRQVQVLKSLAKLNFSAAKDNWRRLQLYHVK